MPVIADYNNLRTVFLTDMCDALHTRNTYISKVDHTSMDIAEICGGVARTTQVAIRFRFKTGSNFDLITGFDLTIPAQNLACLDYFIKHEVFCAIMAPVCGPYGPMSNLNISPSRNYAKESERSKTLSHTLWQGCSRSNCEGTLFYSRAATPIKTLPSSSMAKGACPQKNGHICTWPP